MSPTSSSLYSFFLVASFAKLVIMELKIKISYKKYYMSSETGEACDTIVRSRKKRKGGKRRSPAKTFEERKKETSRLMSKYPGHVAIWLIRPPESGLPPFVKSKYLIPEAMNVGNLLIALRKDIEALYETSVTSSVPTCIPLELNIVETSRGKKTRSTSPLRFNFSELVGTIYDKHRGDDGYLVVSIHSPHFRKTIR